MLGARLENSEESVTGRDLVRTDEVREVKKSSSEPLLVNSEASGTGRDFVRTDEVREVKKSSSEPASTPTCAAAKTTASCVSFIADLVMNGLNNERDTKSRELRNTRKLHKRRARKIKQLAPMNSGLRDILIQP